MALDDTLPKNLNTSSKDKGPVGCTSFIINNPNAQVKYYYLFSFLVTGKKWLTGQKVSIGILYTNSSCIHIIHIQERLTWDPT